MVGVIKSHLREETAWWPRTKCAEIHGYCDALEYWTSCVKSCGQGLRLFVTPFSIKWDRALNLSETQFPVSSRGVIINHYENGLS